MQKKNITSKKENARACLLILAGLTIIYPLSPLKLGLSSHHKLLSCMSRWSLFLHDPDLVLSQGAIPINIDLPNLKLDIMFRPV